MKNQRQRAKRGSVKVNLRGDRIQLRWTAAGKRFSLSVGINSPLNLHHAKKLAAQIEQDLIVGAFDPTLTKYKPAPIEQPEPATAKSTVELFEQFIEHKRHSGTSGQAISTRFNALLSNLRRFGKPIDSEPDARKFVDLLRSRQSPQTANHNLTTLKSFGDWAVEQRAIETNYFSTIKPVKAPRTASPRRKPFTRVEVVHLLETAKTHPDFYQWHDFAMALLYLGLRPSEAIGLRWQDVDLGRALVTVAESLARDERGRSGGTSRVRKGTKTGNIRVLPIPASLLEMLKGRWSPQTAPSQLIFHSPRGKPIDDHNFSQRVWRSLCSAAGVPYRVPYASRHTLLSHGLESGGMSLHQAQYIAGHSSPRLILETYGHMLDRPDLIDWGKGNDS